METLVARGTSSTEEARTRASATTERPALRRSVYSFPFRLPRFHEVPINTYYQTHEMESLLSLSFDYLSSYDGVKVRKGVRQLEGLLAQICLSRSSSAQDRRSSVAGTNGATKQAPKELGQLKDDPAFREFFKLQDGFEWNGPSS